MMKNFVVVDDQGVIVMGFQKYVPEVGPPPPMPLPENCTCAEVPEPFVRPESSTQISKLSGGEVVLEETATMAEMQARAIASIDEVADAARLAVVGDAARIKEYERAQAGAETYRDAGFTGPVPPGVASWAYAKRRANWTARQAAEDILASSARWYAALDGIRALRLDAKETIRAAVTNEEVTATAATFRVTLTAAMQGVQ